MKTRWSSQKLLMWLVIEFFCLGSGMLIAAQEPIFWKDFAIDDFSKMHSPVKDDDNECLIFGKIPISQPAGDLSPELSAFLGRWEGYDYSQPVPKDIKVVLVIREISETGGKAVLWGGNNLQYPFDVKEIEFRVIPGEQPSIEWDANWPDRSAMTAVFVFSYNQEREQLEGGIRLPFSDTTNQPIILTRARSFYVYKDYEEYLSQKRITLHHFEHEDLRRYGAGYLAYLPEGYELEPDTTWPLILFLCGSGDRGDNLFLLAKTGPFQMIREKEPLPFIVVAPGLKMSYEFRSFPDEYMAGVLDEILAAYRIDPKRVYVTGLSMGGEASYRLALYRPEMIAAIAPLCAANAQHNPKASEEGFEAFEPPLDRARDIPIWAIHGTDDLVVPLSAAQKTVDDFIDAGVNVRFTVLENHGHDVWTDMYTDPELYEWFLQQAKP